MAARGEVEGVADGEIHFGVVRVDEGDHLLAVGKGFGIGDVYLVSRKSTSVRERWIGANGTW